MVVMTDVMDLEVLGIMNEEVDLKDLREVLEVTIEVEVIRYREDIITTWRLTMTEDQWKEKINLHHLQSWMTLLSLQHILQTNQKYQNPPSLFP